MGPLVACICVCSSQTPPAAKPNPDLDFWVGTWIADSHRPDGSGKVQVQKDAASNTVTKTMDGKVVEENFSMPGFTGRSLSVHNAGSNRWHQTWVDNSGGYLAFEGGKQGDEFVLNQVFPSADMRMRFTQIKPDSFVWIWEKKEAGKWNLRWQLDYRRKN